MPARGKGGTSGQMDSRTCLTGRDGVILLLPRWQDLNREPSAGQSLMYHCAKAGALCQFAHAWPDWLQDSVRLVADDAREVRKYVALASPPFARNVFVREKRALGRGTAPDCILIQKVPATARSARRTFPGVYCPRHFVCFPQSRQDSGTAFISTASSWWTKADRRSVQHGRLGRPGLFGRRAVTARRRLE